MQIQLSDHFTYGKLFRFTLPSVVMMIFTSIYGVVDGFFVSNFIGKTTFAAVNFIWPLLMMLGAVGFMFGAGGSALVAKTLGEGDRERANKLFSLVVYVSIACGIVITTLGLIFIRPIVALLGAEGQMLEDAVTYGRVLLLTLTPFMLQMEFQSFFITAERPNLGLWVTVASGVTNMVLDALLVAVFPLGIIGAAMATALSQAVGGILSLIYFLCPQKSLLRLTKTRFYGKELLKACTNGSSELMSNISMSLVSMLYNFQLMKYAGEDGVAAYGVLMYVNFVFISMFIGYVVGVAPIVSFHYGAGNTSELKSLLRKSIILISVSSLAMLAISEGLAYPFTRIFVSSNPELFDMTLRGFRIYSFSFLFAGFALFGSCFFTALNDGLTSAVISFLRTLIFQTSAVILLPLIWDLDGVWMSIIVAELMAVMVTVAFMIGKKKKYKY